jgi:hypothetical protein
MNEIRSKQECQCQCGDTKFSIHGEPLIRIFCHCTICQQFNDAAFADISIFRSKDVQFPDNQKVNFKKYRSPPAAQRGKCATCNKATIEFLNLPVFPPLTIIPSQNIPSGKFLVEPLTHVFYDSRVKDINDTLPKHSGYIKSQIAVSARLISAMLTRLKNA